MQAYRRAPLGAFTGVPQNHLWPLGRAEHAGPGGAHGGPLIAAAKVHRGGAVQSPPLRDTYVTVIQHDVAGHVARSCHHVGGVGGERHPRPSTSTVCVREGVGACVRGGYVWGKVY